MQKMNREGVVWGGQSWGFGSRKVMVEGWEGCGGWMGRLWWRDGKVVVERCPQP